MLDFVIFSQRSNKKGNIEIYPKFIVQKSNDLMIQGHDFYAIWNEYEKRWCTDKYEAIALIDKQLDIYVDEKGFPKDEVKVLHLWDASNHMIDSWIKYYKQQMPDSFHPLDEKLIFANTEVKKRDYSSKNLPYALEKGPHEAWDTLMNVLYSKEEKDKIEWAIGSIVSGDSKKIQKFMVLYGSAGTGKSTVLNIIQKLFDGYFSVFDSEALGSSNSAFALEAFKSNPLVAIQHDGDLSRIETNTRLNSLVSHEIMTVNEKFKSTYTQRFKCFLFMGTNKPVRITDSKSGLIRRLIDVTPTGNKLPNREYNKLVKQIDFELGAIAYYCRDLYLSDPNRYDDYVPVAMMGASNDMYNFIDENYYIFRDKGVTLKAAYDMYKDYCVDANVSYPLNRRAFKEELRNYFIDFSERDRLEDGTQVRNWYSGLKTDKFNYDKPKKKKNDISNSYIIDFKKQHSLFDDICSDCLAQYGNEDEKPSFTWKNVKTTLNQLDTSQLHYVRVPINHIVIDFDIPDESGNKSYEKNLEEASKWPKTYAELSKSGKGIHLHYIYAGDPEKLSRLYSEHIEVKVFSGKSSLRRKLTLCNDIPIATINSGLPLKDEKKKMINAQTVKSQKKLKEIIQTALNKEYENIPPYTKPNIDFIAKVLDDAYNSNLTYDIRNMTEAVYSFAIKSTHNSSYCVDKVRQMHFCSKDILEGEALENIEDDEAPIVFYDIECFINLFLVCYKFAGEKNPVIPLINPNPEDIEKLFKYRLIGFNCRRYDNHMLYARASGYSLEECYNLSQNIIASEKGSNRDCFFGPAWNISYTDIYDYAATKQSLKKWEIELGYIHKELGLPWNEPVPDDKLEKVIEYCKNDVMATEYVHNHLKGDFEARLILAELAGGTPNDTTNSLTTKFIFGNEKHPELVYTDLKTGERSDGTKDDICFPEYEYVQFGDDGKPHNLYLGEDAGFGGYVYAEPGMYSNVKCYDVAGMHPASIRALNAFGKYTSRFGDIVDARLALKHKEYDKVKEMFDGKLIKYLDDPSALKSLIKALKIAVNSVYGLTSAKFDNPFRDSRNVNNIVALRGALFIMHLKNDIQKMGYTVIHCKTDSIKVVNPTKELEEFIMSEGKKYGYIFEVEHSFKKICLVNDAVYVGKLADDDPEEPGKWTATGTQFAVPFIFKTLFSKEPIEFSDYCETKSVKTDISLDMNEDLPDVTEYENQLKKLRKQFKDGKITKDYLDEQTDILQKEIEKGHSYQFVGKVGLFTPIKPGCGGGLLVRSNNDIWGKKYDSVVGTKDFRWLESSDVLAAHKEDDIDILYYTLLVDEAVNTITQYGDFEQFIADDDNSSNDILP